MKFTNWNKKCISSPRFSISLSGTLVGYFKGEKGLRQGDSLSLYLFVKAIEIFRKIMEDWTGGVCLVLNSIIDALD
jgi:hypothetical protein